MTDRFKLVAAIFVALIKDNKVFLIKRANTGWEDGNYALIGGHLDGNETAIEAAIREVREEAGVDIEPKDLKFFNVSHLITNTERIHISFVADNWKGEPKNNEPEKADNAGWFPLEQLPEKTAEVVKHIIRCYLEKVPYTEFGWEKRA